MSANMEPLKAQEGVTQEMEEGNALLSKILDEGRLARDDFQTTQAKGLLAEFVQQVMQGQLVMSKDMEGPINPPTAEIDRLLSAQLNEIMHAEEFQKLEGSWRGLHHLVFETETSSMLKIRVMSINKKELLRDLEKAIEFDQSAIFKKIYEEEFGTF